MEDKEKVIEGFFSKEKQEILSNLKEFLDITRQISEKEDYRVIKRYYKEAFERNLLKPDALGFDPLFHALTISLELSKVISPDRSMILAVLLAPLSQIGFIESEEIKNRWGEDTVALLDGLQKINNLYEKRTAVDTDNFRKLLLTFAQDIRVIIIMIVERYVIMRAINHHPNQNLVKEVAFEAKFLYAPLAHRLGLYKIKSELEDMSLKYLNRDIYTRIARKLNETKSSRDAYIAAFIEPVKKRLEAHGLKFEIKGRTKSISSIWNKMQKQNNDLEQIYDLFAIRIILDVSPEKEKSECWLAYSVVTDMYQPNPARLKDWLSIPKSNGYESLHITVMGPNEKWVEIQIRSKRMDETAERGVAAHWKYKGIKSENTLDVWMNRVREIIESADTDPQQLIKDFKMDLYKEEVFVFTPRGDLYKLPLGASVLDFAFNIHSKIGSTCIGGKVNGRNKKINHKLKSGDTVEILTSSTQTPKSDWLNYVVTSKARNKIRQSLNERRLRQAELGKELFSRRCKNRKVEIEESALMRVIKKMGYKTVTDFFVEVAEEKIDPIQVISLYDELNHKDDTKSENRSAEEFTLQPEIEENTSSSDILVIGENIKGVNYKMAKCCNPIYGDNVFGFISSEGVIKIHRCDCPNASNIQMRYPYRIINTRWSGKSGQHFAVTLSVVGIDDIGIVTNISSIINKEKDVMLRSISIDSNDGIFKGHLTVGIADTSKLNELIKKIKTVKGVKDVQRIK